VPVGFTHKRSRGPAVESEPMLNRCNRSVTGRTELMLLTKVFAEELLRFGQRYELCTMSKTLYMCLYHPIGNTDKCDPRAQQYMVNQVVNVQYQTEKAHLSYLLIGNDDT